MQDYGTPDRVPPNNLDAERAVLGASLLDKDALLYVVESLRPEDFYEPRHSVAFEVMSEMAAKDRAVDSLTFREELLKRNLLERVGGISFVAMLVDCVTTTANTEHHCSIVKDKSIHRDLIRVGADIARTGFSEEVDSVDALATAEQRVFEIAGLHFDMNIINGHSKGGLLFFCMLEGRQIMFAGDFIHISPFNRHAIIGWEGDLEYDDAVYLEELKRFSTYEPDMILSGHHQLCMRDAWQIPKNAYVRACSSKHRSLNPNVPY